MMNLVIVSLLRLFRARFVARPSQFVFKHSLKLVFGQLQRQEPLDGLDFEGSDTPISMNETSPPICTISASIGSSRPIGLEEKSSPPKSPSWGLCLPETKTAPVRAISSLERCIIEKLPLNPMRRRQAVFEGSG
jgi:hypothetical protein